MGESGLVSFDDPKEKREEMRLADLAGAASIVDQFKQKL